MKPHHIFLWIVLYFWIDASIGQTRVVAPDTISTNDVFGLTLNADQTEAFWVKSWGGRDSLMILTSHKVNNHWSTPQPAPFSVTTRKFKDIDPFFAPDGKTILFNSNRFNDPKNFDIWIVKKQKNGWGEPSSLGKVINSDSSDFYATMASNGNIYFTSNRAGGYGKTDIYVATQDKGKYNQPVNLGNIVNTAGFESNPYISPKEDFLIFLATDRKDGYGDSDLYITFKKETGWTTPQNLGNVINTTHGEFCPSMSADGKYFYFSRVKKGKKWEENIYQVERKELDLEALKKQAH
ncbi:hypothetical protein [Xanthocytophaga agilis]|uniref:WD40-like Beta Propeller Repeat n=1 Tax=Xanthocytophaga agilis TaxID=3048010 RepID=A0AAE3RAK9_9BACT|nr:hypothetical protein [Xanthocytophaga agilis]MDJ1504504.1 hypothetical protein [Xanthocytophaga agilis]